MKQRTKSVDIPSDWWWRNSPNFDLERDRCVPKPGSKAGYDRFWKPFYFTAWTYELVRRLPNFKDIGNEISAEDLAIIKGLSPYPELTSAEHHWLNRLVVVPMSEAIRVERNPRALSRANYTAPLRPFSFDLTKISKKGILEFLGHWIDSEFSRLGIAQSKGLKGGKSRNQNQSYKFGEWKLVEAARSQNKNLGAMDTPLQKLRRRAKKHGLNYYQVVIQACRMAKCNIIPMVKAAPMWPELTGKTFSLKHLESVLKKRSEAEKIRPV